MLENIIYLVTPNLAQSTPRHIYCTYSIGVTNSICMLENIIYFVTHLAQSVLCTIYILYLVYVGEYYLISHPTSHSQCRVLYTYTIC
jgi:hypothetical protein